MLQQLLYKRILPCLPKNYWLNRINQMSNDSIKDNCEISNADQTIEDSSQTTYSKNKVLQLLKESATFKDANNKDWTTTPYPKDILTNNKDQEKLKINPEDTSVVLFPGQGTIKVGMVKKYMQYPAAKELFEIASEIVQYNLLKLCLDGPQEKLNRTEFNQAATVISSLVALEKIKADRSNVFDTCVVAAGYSVGEISALIFSSAITFEDGIRLAWIRGKAMQYAADKVPQGMLSVFCTPTAQVSKACTEAKTWAKDLGVENPVCNVAIFLHTAKKILAGNREALEYIEKHQAQFGLSNVTRLPVSGAFHTNLMEPALKPVQKLLGSIEINVPRCQVYSNYRGEPYNNMRFMKKYIWKQIVSSVKWEQCVQNIYKRPEGIPYPQTYDVASEGRMRTILKLINAKASKSCTVV